MLGEIFAIILMLVGSYVLIRFMAWVLTNKDEALGRATSGEEDAGGSAVEAARRDSPKTQQQFNVPRTGTGAQ